MVQDAPVQEAVVDTIRERGEPMQPKEIIEATGRSRDSVNSALKKLKERGDLVQPAYGKYDLPERVEAGRGEAKEKLQSELPTPKERANQRKGRAVRDPIYPTVASQGDGSWEIKEDAIGYIEGEDALSRPGRSVFWMPVRGDSMKDTLPKGGLVPVQRFDPTWTELREDDVYLFRLESAIQIKRLQRRPDGRIRVVSDNDAYDDFNITVDDGVDFEILGRVLV